MEEIEQVKLLLRGAIERLSRVIKLLEAAHGFDPSVLTLKEGVFNPIAEVLMRFDKDWYEEYLMDEEVDPHIFDDIQNLTRRINT